MNKIFRLKVVVGILALVVVGGAFFYACKKDIQPAESIKKAHKLTGVSMNNIDFGSIGKQDGMLVFQSWEHYIHVIEALQDVCIAYTQKQIKDVLATKGIDLPEGNSNTEENPDGESSFKLDEDIEEYLDEQLEAKGFSQFAPIYDFCQALEFNSLYEVLEEMEVEWKNNPEIPVEENPFISRNMGRYQSALHNRNGKVIIAGEIHTVEEFSNEASTQKANCRNEDVAGESPHRLDGKYKRYLHAHCWTNQSFTRVFNNTWKINTKKNNRRSDWWPAHYIRISGYKYSDCEGYNSMYISKSWDSSWSGYFERWHVQTTLPARLHPYDQTKFTSYHQVDGIQIILYM